MRLPLAVFGTIDLPYYLGKDYFQSDHKCNFTGVLLLQVCSKTFPIFGCDRMQDVKQMTASYPGPILQASGCDGLIPMQVFACFHFHFQFTFHCHFLFLHVPDRGGFSVIPGRCCLQFLIACSMQKWRGKARDIESRA